MKIVILVGGLGTRLTEETEVKPKPMVEIGDWPILWHILKLYAHHQFFEFFLALGYRGEMIKKYFLDYYNLNGNITIDFHADNMQTEKDDHEDWVIHLIETGQKTNTGGRVKRLEPWLKGETFMATYGDAVSDIDLYALLQFHRSHGRIATVTAVRPPARFGGIVFEGDIVKKFTEKPQIGEGWINGGFLVFEPEIFNYLENDQSSLEADLLEHLAADGQLAAYRHEGFWQCMDTLRDKRLLESYWQSGNAPWKVWK